MHAKMIPFWRSGCVVEQTYKTRKLVEYSKRKNQVQEINYML